MWPVPMTMQTLAMLAVVMTLGLHLGTGAVLTYLGAGAAGLPVFAGGGGIAYLTGPTAGYLLGFIATAWVVGALADRGLTRRPLGALALALLGSAIVYACGVAWLSGFIGFDAAVRAGVLPFLPGDLVKALVLALALPALMRLVVRAG
jgi:biotin transport system substrate-specific component